MSLERVEESRGHCKFVLVDGICFDFEEFGTFRHAMPCISHKLHKLEHLVPVVVEIASLSEAQRKLIHQRWELQVDGECLPSICAYLDCNCTLQEVSEHLANFLMGEGPNGMPVFWRFFDPRVFAMALHVLSPMQVDAVLGPIQHWYFSYAGREWTVKNSHHSIDPLEWVDAGWPTEEQWQDLHQAPAIERALCRLMNHNGSLPYESSTLIPRLVEIMKEGRTCYGLTNSRDQEEFAVLTYLHGDRFREHPHLQELWLMLAQGRIKFQQVLSELTDSDWDRLEFHLTFEKRRLSYGHEVL